MLWKKKRPVFLGSVAAIAFVFLAVSATAQTVDYSLTGKIPDHNSVDANAVFSLTFSAPMFAVAAGDTYRAVSSRNDAVLTMNGVRQFSSKSIDFGVLQNFGAGVVLFMDVSNLFPVRLSIYPEIYASEVPTDFDGIPASEGLFWAVQMATFAPQKVTGIVGKELNSVQFPMIFSAVAVPEPSTPALLGVALLGVWGFSRRTRRSSLVKFK